MKLLRAFIRSRYPWAILAGLALAASFPNINLPGLAWVAPGLILLSALGKSGKAAFRIGYVAGLAHYLASLYWLLLIPVAWFPILGWAALSAFLALYPALWVWLTWKLFPGKLTGEGPARVIENLAEQFVSVPWAQRLAWTISGAAFWVAMEMTVARFLGGFPWNLLGSSQYRMTPLLEIAAFTGIYGVSFLAVWSALSLLCAGMVIFRRPAKRSACMGEIMLPMLAVLGIYAVGYHKLLQPDKKSPTLTVTLIQPSIPQNLIWDPNANEQRFAQLLQLSEQAARDKPDLMIWPEAALPKMLRYDEETLTAVTSLARAHKMWMIVGSDDAEKRTQPSGREQSDYFNSSFLISPEGDLVQRYNKRGLVIFGEYVPLLDWLPFLKYFTPIDGGFTAGDKVVPFEMKSLNVKVATLICFEDVFPQLAREYVDGDTDFLVNLTNDGWFGEGAAQWQQAAAAVFRTVENGVPLVRCSNTGLTCWVDASGRIRQYFQTSAHGIYGPGYMTAQIPLLNPGETRAPTYYRQHGDMFGWGCVAFAALQLLRAWMNGRRTQRKF